MHESSFSIPRITLVVVASLVIGAGACGGSNVSSRRLPNGEFNHSSTIELLDPEGRKVAQTSMLAKLDAEFLARLRTELAKP